MLSSILLFLLLCFRINSIMYFCNGHGLCAGAHYAILYPLQICQQSAQNRPGPGPPNPPHGTSVHVTMFRQPRITKFVDSLRKVPEGESIEQLKLKDYLQPWGFTIYRTYYGPGANEQWDKLLQNITTGVKHRLKATGGSNEDPAMITKAEELFKLDARSDPAVLDGLILEEVRQLYHDGTGGQPLNKDNGPWRVFILVDADVLASPDLGMIKCVAADYDAAAAVPKNTTFGPQRYFGWLTMSSERVLDLWFELEMYFFEEIGNSTAGGPGAWWDPDKW